MNKLYLVIVLFFLFSNQVFTQDVDLKTAEHIALNFYMEFTKNDDFTGKPELMQTTYCGQIPVFEFRIGDNDWVCIARDKSYSPIVQFSNDGNYRSPDSPLPIVGNALGRSSDNALTQPTTKSAPISQDYSAKWEYYENSHIMKSTRSTTSVNPLLSTSWGQEEFYNAMAPSDPAGPGGHVMLGCVAVAKAQYMKYIADTDGSFPSYGQDTWQWESYPSQYVDFSNANYDYYLMPNSLDASTPADSTNELSQFLADIAVACHTMYGSGISGAFVDQSWYSLLNHFSFNAGRREIFQEYFGTEYFPIDTWTQMLTDELDAGNVVMYGGIASNYSWSHWFVIDGYYESGGDTFFHCNWGWNGAGNGYFTLDNLAPLGFVALDMDQSMLSNISPETANINSSTTWSGTMNPTGSIVVREEETLTINAGTQINMSDGAEFLVFGALVVNGTAGNPVLFTVPNSASDRFNSVRIWTQHMKTGQASSIDHCIIEYSDRNIPGAVSTLDCVGGGLLAAPNLNHGHSITINHLEVRYCSSYGGGGACIRSPGTFTGLSIHDNVLFHTDSLIGTTNSAGPGTGLYILGLGYGFPNLPDYTIMLDSCDFSNNTIELGTDWLSIEGGGALGIRGSSNETLVVKNSEFSNNGAYRGSAIYCHTSRLKIENSQFSDHIVSLPYNTTPEGVIYLEGWHNNPNVPDNMDVVGCLFEDNNMSAIWTSTEDTVTITNTTVREHTANNGAILTIGELWYQPPGSYDLHLDMSNVIGWDNTTTILVSKFDADIVPVLDIQYSDLQGGDASIDPAIGYTLPSTNINTDPLLNTNGQLSANSPCVNAGTPDTTGLNLPDYDLWGVNRVEQGQVDIGASEYDINAWSIAAFVDDATIIEGDTTNIWVEVTGAAGYTVSWTSNPSGFTFASDTTEVWPEQDTWYIVEVNNQGQILTDSVHVTVDPIPWSIQAFVDPATVVEGGDCEVWVEVTGVTGYSVTWSSNPAGFSSTVDTNTVTPLVDTWYIASVMYDDSTQVDSVQVFVNPWNISATVLEDSICEDGTAQLWADVVGLTGCTVSWTSNPAGFTASGDTIWPSPIVDTWYIASVTNGSVSKSDSSLITVVDLLAPSFGAFSDSITIDTDPFQITATPAGGIWSGCTSDGWIYPDSLSLGWNSFYYSVTNIIGCPSMVEDSIFMYEPGQWSIYIDYTQDEICLGDITTLWVVIVGAGTFDVAWTSNPPGFSSSLSQITVSPDQDTWYIVSVTDSDTTQIDSLLVSVFPYLDAEFGSFPDSVLNTIPEFEIPVTPDGGEWSGATTDGWIYPNTAPLGWNVFYYTIENEIGCETSISDSVFVDINVGIDGIDGTGGIQIYPNPNEGNFTVKLRHFQGNVNLSLYSTNGKIFWSNKVLDGLDSIINITCPDLVPGVYILCLDHKKGKEKYKIIIR